MNIKAQAKRILCFGDSNTWGRDPVEVNKRYPANVRWTGVLQQHLGESFEILEEGLQARTTNLDDPNKAGRNGQTYLLPCLLTHDPLDMVVLMLGTNDMKEKFNQTPGEIAEAINSLVQLIKTTIVDLRGKEVPILVVVPPPVREEFFKPETQFRGAGEKSKVLAAQVKKQVTGSKVEVLDLADFAQSGEVDGVHFDASTHQKIGEVIAKKVDELCP